MPPPFILRPTHLGNHLHQYLKGFVYLRLEIVWCVLPQGAIAFDELALPDLFRGRVSKDSPSLTLVHSQQLLAPGPSLLDNRGMTTGIRVGPLGCLAPGPSSRVSRPTAAFRSSKERSGTRRARVVGTRLARRVLVGSTALCAHAVSSFDRPGLSRYRTLGRLLVTQVPKWYFQRQRNP